MRFYRNKVAALFFGRSMVSEGWEFHFSFIPRRDLTPEGYIIYCAWGVDVHWPSLYRVWPKRPRVGWLHPRVYFRSDVRWITETVAARAGA